jgi:hypothetical protein
MGDHMGAEPRTREAFDRLAAAMDVELELSAALRSALEACLPYAEKAKENARTDKQFKQARSAYRMACAALGIDHE